MLKKSLVLRDRLIFVLVISGAALLVALLVFLEPKNLLQNGSFEKGFMGWTLVDGGQTFGEGFPKNKISQDSNFRIKKFNEYIQEITSYIRLVLYIPSDGEAFLRVKGDTDKIFFQVLDTLTPGRKYLVLFDARNEYGTVSPKLEVLSNTGAEIISKKVTMQMAQVGWVRSGLVFEAPDSGIKIQLGSRDKKGYSYVNHYDNIRIFDITDKSELAAIKTKEKIKFDSDFVEDKRVSYRPLIGKRLITMFFDEEIRELGLPIYDLYYDEYAFWNRGANKTPGNARPEYVLFMPFGRSGMLRGELVINGGQIDRVKLKTRGIMAVHHASKLRSLRIDLNKDSRIDLLNPQGRALLGEAFSNFLSKQVGLINLRNKFVFLRVNDVPIGIFWLFQKEKGDIELSGRPNGILIESDSYPYLLDKPPEKWNILYDLSDDAYNKKYQGGMLINFFHELLKKGEYDKASQVLNVDKFIDFDVQAKLTNAWHQVWHENHLIFWDSTRGQLEWIPWDTRFNSLHEDIRKTTKRHVNPYQDFFIGRNLANCTESNKRLWEYVSTESTVVEATDFLAKLYEGTKAGFEKTVFFESGGYPVEEMAVVSSGEIDDKNKKIVEQFSKRVEHINKLLSENERVFVGVERFPETVTFEGERFQVVGVHVSLKNKNSYSSTVLRSVLFGGSGEDSGSGVAFSVAANKLFPSGFYVQERLAGLWRDDFEKVAGSRVLSFSEQQLIKNSYIRDGNKPYFKLKDELKVDSTVMARITRILEKTDGLEKREVDLFFLVDTRKDFRTEDISFVFENGSTGAEIVNKTLPDRVNFPVDYRTQIINRLNGGSVDVSVFIEQSVFVGEHIPQNNKNSINPVDKSFYNAVLENFSGIFRSRKEFLRENLNFTAGSQENEITLPTGSYDIPSTILIPKNLDLTIAPGTVLKFGESVSLISYGKIFAKGTAENPIQFISQSDSKNWGVVGLIQEDSGGEFENCIFQGGNDAYLNGVYFSGMLSAYHNTVSINNCVFSEASNFGGDDAVNFRNGNFSIQNSSFLNNKYDAVDYDFATQGSKITDSFFKENGNDGMDISGSEVYILNNLVVESGDKGFSVGENSTAVVYNNVFSNSKFGVAVKDSSVVKLFHNEITNNHVGISAYNKKPFFGGAEVHIFNTQFSDNYMDFGKEFIQDGDRRISGNKYNSEIFVSNSKYVTSEKSTSEIINEPSKHNLSKKEIQRFLDAGTLVDYGFDIALLENEVTKKKLNLSNLYLKAKNIGLNEELLRDE